MHLPIVVSWRLPFALLAFAIAAGAAPAFAQASPEPAAAPVSTPSSSPDESAVSGTPSPSATPSTAARGEVDVVAPLRSEPATSPNSRVSLTQQAVAAAPMAAPEPPIDPWILHTKDNKFTLRIGAQIQFRYTASDAQKKSDQNSFKMQEVRPQIRATLGKPWLTVFIQPELANVPQLLDLELTAQPIPAIGLKVGQFLTPFSRTFYTPVPKLLFQDFSIANTFFRADRETGAMLFGTPFEGKLEYYAGAFNGNRINQNGNDDDKLMFVGRVAANPFGALPYDETPALSGRSKFLLGLGANGYYGKVPPAQAANPAFPLPTNTTPMLAPNAPAPRDTTSTVGGDFQMRYWLATLQAEYYARQLEHGAGGPDTKSQGGYVHASTFVYWPYVELAARVSYLDPDTKKKKDDTMAYEGAMNLYAFGNNMKLNLRYIYADNPALSAGTYKPGARPATNTFLAQTQWYF